MMTDETITAEQKKQGKIILERFNDHSRRLFWLWVPLMFLVAKIFKFDIHGKNCTQAAFGLILLPLGTLSIHCIVTLWFMRRYFQKLPTIERILLTHTASKWNNELFVPIQLITDINPQKEYLRPSQQSQDETLLRAANHTDTTPQEQLLRPSKEDQE